MVAMAGAAEGELREGEEALLLVETFAYGNRDSLAEHGFEVDEWTQYEGVEAEAKLVRRPPLACVAGAP